MRIKTTRAASLALALFGAWASASAAQVAPLPGRIAAPLAGPAPVVQAPLAPAAAVRNSAPAALPMAASAVAAPAPAASAPAAASAEGASVSAGPLTAGVGRRIAPRVEELARFAAARQDERASDGSQAHWTVAERLATMPRGWDRDLFLTMIPAPLYARMSSPEIAALLALVHWPGAYEVAAIPGKRVVSAEAWARLDAADAATLLSAWDNVTFNKKYHEAAIKAAIVRSWIAAHPGETRALPELLARIPSGWDRDHLITSLSDAAMSAMTADERAATLALLYRPGDYQHLEVSPHRHVTASAAKHVARDVQAFLTKWGSNGPNS